MRVCLILPIPVSTGGEGLCRRRPCQRLATGVTDTGGKGLSTRWSPAAGLLWPIPYAENRAGPLQCFARGLAAYMACASAMALLPCLRWKNLNPGRSLGGTAQGGCPTSRVIGRGMPALCNLRGRC